MESNALTATGPRPRVELRLAGAFGVMRDGAELAEYQVGSRKSRLLLKLLAAARPGLLSADQIAEVLWDGAPPAAAERNIASLISRLRAVLGAEVIEGGRAGYRLGGELAVAVDLDIASRHASRRSAGSRPRPPWRWLPPPAQSTCWPRELPSLMSRTRTGRMPPASNCAGSCAGLG